MKKLKLPSFLLAGLLLLAVGSSALAVTPAYDFSALWSKSPTAQTPSWTILTNSIQVSEPSWIKGYYCNDTALYVYNVADPSKVKNVWVTVTYTDASFMAGIADPYIADYNPNDVTSMKNVMPGSQLVSRSTNGLAVTWQWTITPQPAFEVIQFASSAYHDLCNIESVSVATQCVPVPEPSSVIALLSGCAGMYGMIVRRKRS